MTSGPAEVVGRVSSVDGWPLAGVAVTALAATGAQLGRVVTDELGAYRLPVPVAGPLTLVVAAAGLDPRAVPVTARPGTTDVPTVTLVSTAATALPPTGRWVLDPDHCVVRATARHLGLSRIEGRFSEVAGELVVADPVEDSRVAVRIGAASLSTGSRGRDEHLHSADFLDVERYADLTYASTGLTVVGGGRWRVDGQLTIRDITRSVPLEVTYLGTEQDPWGGTRSAFLATAQLARRDFEMGWNTGLPGGLSLVGPTLKIDLDVQAVLQA